MFEQEELNLEEASQFFPIVGLLTVPLAARRRKVKATGIIEARLCSPTYTFQLFWEPDRHWREPSHSS